MGLIVLTVIFLIGVFSRNAVMILSALVLLAAHFLGASQFVALLGTHGVPAGVVVLIMVVLLPLLDGAITPQGLLGFLRQREGLAAVLVGAVATYLGGEGVALMKSSPEVVVGIVVGTTLGTVFFRGIPTGPLVAAGVVALALRLLL